MIATKTILTILGTALATTAAVLPLTTNYIYSSDFRCAYPIDGAFNMVPSPQNVWHAVIEDIEAGGTEVVVDIDGNNQRDQDNPLIRVCITDAKYLGGPADVEIRAGSTLLWTLRRNSSNSPPEEVHFTTPLVVPVGEPLTVEIPISQTLAASSCTVAC